MSPSLAQLVKKWLKTYSSKSNWDFSYEWDDDKGQDDLKVGYLRIAGSYSLPCPAIKIENDQATIGRFTAPSHVYKRWDAREWTTSIHSGVKLVAADPRFFSKLDKVMQFLTREDKRRTEADKRFDQEEVDRLKEILR